MFKDHEPLNQSEPNHMSSTTPNPISFNLEISDEKTLASIQVEFNSNFPYLKLEFFKSPHNIGEASSKSLLYNTNRFIRDCRIRHTSGLIKVDEKMTVNALEESFLHDFGLSVQVFRKSGSVWLETSATDNWTLREQNEEGSELSKHI